MSFPCRWPRGATVAVLGLLVAIGFSVSARPAHGAQANRLTVVYPFRVPAVAAAGDYARASIPGCGRLRRVGEPAVPFRTARILLPQDTRIVAAEARLLEAERPIGLARPLEFGRLAVPLGADAQRVATARALDKPKPDIYGRDAAYPARRVEVVGTQRMCGYTIAILRLYPARYAPRQRRLLFCPRLEVELTLAPQAAGAAAAQAIAPRPADAARVALLVDNPEDLGVQPAASATEQTAQGAAIYDYLLVTSAALLPYFQPLIDQKIADGLAVLTATMESIDPGYPASPDPELLRAYIRDAYQNSGITYVLLGGDKNTVPVRGVHGHVEGAAAKALGDYTDNNIPCDLYYACLDGTWNFDGDAIWGEPGDGDGGGDVDLLAEVYIGRAPVDTSTKVQRFVAKIVNYEQNGHPNPWNALFLGESLGDGAQGGDGLDPLLPHFSSYDIEWLDDRVSTWSGTGDCLPALNQSPHLVAHSGHANWSYVMRLTNSNLSGLTNTGHFLVHSIGCYSGAFDYSDCIAEEFIKRNAYGAFAVIMNSRYGWYNPSHEWMFSGEFQEAFFDRLLDQGYTNIGVAHQLAKHDMLGQVEHSDGDGGMVYRWCYFEITLFGDPHLALNTSVPETRALTVQAYDATPGVEEAIEGVTIGVSPPPDVVTEATTSYDIGSSVTLTAPEAHGALSFLRWRLDGADQPAGQRELALTMDDDHEVVAVYFTPGILVQPTSGLETDEGGGTAEFTVVLGAEPTADVTIGLSSSDPTEGTVSPASVTFTDADWDQPQTVTVTGVDDGELDGFVGYTILTAPAESGDPGFNGSDPPDVAVINYDNEVLDLRLDFGTSSSPLAGGWTRVTNATSYSAAKGYGWQSSVRLLSADRGTGSDVERDFNYVRSGTFAVDVPPGTFEVTVTLGDLGPYAHEQMGVYLEGVQVDVVSAAAGQVVTRTYQVAVTDGQLALGLVDLGGSDPNVVIEALVVSSAGGAAAAGADAGLAAIVTPEDGPAPLAITAVGVGAEAGEGYVWDFGDGTTGTGAVVTHTYWSPGSYAVILRAGDKTAQATVVVREPGAR